MEFLPVATGSGYLFHMRQLVALAANAALLNATGAEKTHRTQTEHYKSTFSEGFYYVKEY